MSGLTRAELAECQNDGRVAWRDMDERVRSIIMRNRAWADVSPCPSVEWLPSQMRDLNKPFDACRAHHSAYRLSPDAPTVDGGVDVKAFTNALYDKVHQRNPALSFAYEGRVLRPGDKVVFRHAEGLHEVTLALSHVGSADEIAERIAVLAWRVDAWGVAIGVTECDGKPMAFFGFASPQTKRKEEPQPLDVLPMDDMDVSRLIHDHFGAAKPTLGVMPRKLWLERRVCELAKAVYERLSAGGGVDADVARWAAELASVVREVRGE